MTLSGLCTVAEALPVPPRVFDRGFGEFVGFRLPGRTADILEHTANGGSRSDLEHVFIHHGDGLRFTSTGANAAVKIRPSPVATSGSPSLSPARHASRSLAPRRDRERDRSGRYRLLEIGECAVVAGSARATIALTRSSLPAWNRERIGRSENLAPGSDAAGGDLGLAVPPQSLPVTLPLGRRGDRFVRGHRYVLRAEPRSRSEAARTLSGNTLAELARDHSPWPVRIASPRSTSTVKNSSPPAPSRADNEVGIRRASLKVSCQHLVPEQCSPPASRRRA